MSQAIIRVAKIKTQGQAQGKTKHNYRLMETPNADSERTATFNQELVNTGQLDYWSLAEQRIGEVVKRKVRDDQVRAMELVLTASPEWFKRDQDGQAEDMRGGKWVEDNLNFLQQKYGGKNVVSFTLHQDEKTPHIHAVVIPITDKNRLSADTLFNPKTLNQLQTEYAQAMRVHGLERGIEGSRRHHRDMKQVYGRQEHAAAELSTLAEPVATVPAQAVQLGKVPLLDREAWREQEQGRINAELVRQVQEANQRTEQANQRAQEAILRAIASAEAQTRSEVLERQLHVSEGLKQGNFDKAQAAQGRVNTVSMRLAGGESVPVSFLDRGNRLLDEASERVRAGREQVAKLHEQAAQAEREGDYGLVAEIRYGKVPEQEAKNTPLEADLSRFAGGRIRLVELDDQQARQEAERIRAAAEQAEQVRLARLAEQQARVEQKRLARLAEQQAREAQTRLAEQQAAEKARQEVLNREDAAKQREQEHARIEHTVGRLLTEYPHIYDLETFTNAAQRAGITVQHPERNQLVLRLVDSAHEFRHQELKPNGQEFGPLLNTQVRANNERWEQDQARGRSNDREMGD
jgi:hypothetical protein